MNYITVGILAHVDSGKTTLAEAVLYRTGEIRTLGRVDHGSTHLDTHSLERERGITIFSSEACARINDKCYTLLDTPGHVDFSAEAERTLSVLDYAILVISGSEGVQNHTETLFRLLGNYNVPTFIFVNKMDLISADKDSVMQELSAKLDGGCVDFSADDEMRDEAISLLDEAVLEKFLSDGKTDDETVTRLIRKRILFPVCFGSALKDIGISEFLDVFYKYTVPNVYGNDFGARVYKISHDEKNGRLTHMKITGGSIAVRSSVIYCAENGEISEKITGMKTAVGAKSENVQNASAGQIVTVSGLSATFPGQGIGTEKESSAPFFEPVLEYRIVLPEGCGIREYFPKLRTLEEEDPSLKLTYNEQLEEIHICLMGEVQTDVIKQLIRERFGIEVKIDSGRTMYRETIAAPVMGVGHFEPLRHYAEVHLYMEPTGPGTGLSFRSLCSRNDLETNWQRLILWHLRERTHRGVLSGMPITDMRISLVAGRAHPKHTEGGDFRQATYRAVRQGLMSARSVILEPYYSYKLTVPSNQIGRAINDIRAMNGSFGEPETDGNGFSTVSGRAPVSAMKNYAAEVTAYTRGSGKFSFEVCGYFPCHDPETVIKEAHYDPEADLAHTPDSVFCAHGAGFIVKWNEVRNYMHLHPADISKSSDYSIIPSPRSVARKLKLNDDELEAIMLKEFGPIKRRRYGERKIKNYSASNLRAELPKDTLYIVDGYNVIFSWDSLKSCFSSDPDAGSASLELARNRLTETLVNFRAYKNCRLILVFDAYNVSDVKSRSEDVNGITVVYTENGETADAYIERRINELGPDYNIRVITSDGLLQLSALSGGVLRMTSGEFEAEVLNVRAEISSLIEDMDKPVSKDSVLRDIGLELPEDR